jgi:hypothetical protein
VRADRAVMPLARKDDRSRGVRLTRRPDVGAIAGRFGDRSSSGPHDLGDQIGLDRLNATLSREACRAARRKTIHDGEAGALVHRHDRST